MTNHSYQSKRKDIVEAICTALRVNNVTDVKDEKLFFRNPFREISEDELPCVKVGILNETSERWNNSIEYERKAEIVVLYVDQGNDNLVDKLYYMAERIENFLINDENTTQVTGELDDMTLQRVNLKLENAEMGTGGVVLTFEGVYYTKHEPVLGDLVTIGLSIKPADAPPADDPIFTEEITLPTV